MSNKPWEFLKPGDIVDIIAPSSSVPTKDLKDFYLKAKELLNAIGLTARIPEDLISLDKDPFSANSLEYRVNHVIEAFKSNSKAIWAIRGGYGAAKLIPFLEKIEAPLNPKLLLGFSDITALHLFLNTKWHWNSLHSAVINGIVNNPKFLEEIEPIIFGKQKHVEYKNLVPLNDLATRKNNIRGEIIGGNLCLIQTSLATSWQIDAKNKIIFIEEVAEKGYKIDRMLNHLKQADVFNNAKAIIFGQIIPELEPNGTNLCDLAVAEFTRNTNIPVVSLPLVGHITNLNSPMPFGTMCELTLGNEITLSCLTGGVEILRNNNAKWQ